MTIEAASTNSSTRRVDRRSSARGIWLASSDAPAPQREAREQQAGGAADAARARAIRPAGAGRRARAPAPSAARIAISFRRFIARARIRLPTLAQAMSSTSADRGEQHQQRRADVADDQFVQRDRGAAPAGVLRRVGSASSRCEITCSSDFACVERHAGLQPRDRLVVVVLAHGALLVGPGERHPQRPGGRAPRLHREARAASRRRSCRSRRRSVSVRPITSGAPPRWLFQNPSLRITTCPRAGESSSGRKVRPSAGWRADDLEEVRRRRRGARALRRPAAAGQRELAEA